MNWRLSLAEKYRLEPLAKKDIKESAKFYEERKVGLGGEFLDEVNLKIQKIVEKPEKYPIYYKEARKSPIQRFPFNIVYIIKKALVSIIGVWHNSREPNKLENRIDKNP